MSLTTTPETYKPKYNPDKDEYNDESPYPPNSKKNLPYICPCKGYLFNKNAQFNAHIVTKCHQNWLNNYKLNNKELDDLMKEKNKLLSEKSILERKLDAAESKLKQYESDSVNFITVKNAIRIMLENIDDDKFHDCLGS